jgi:hypothetical protein
MKNSTKKRLEKKAQERYKLLSKHVFSNFYSQGVSLEAAKEIIRPYIGVIAAQSEWLASTDYFGGDNRSPLDTYGYKSEEAIGVDLLYISDRFNAQFRLDWVLGLFDKNLNKL